MISKTLLAITLCVLFQLSFQIDDPTLPAIVVTTMAQREMRYHHFLWHNLRETWLNLDASTQHAITALGWAPPRPAAFTKEDGTVVPLEDNGSGEDFLYMHRQMVIMVNKLVAGTPYGQIKGWPSVPAPGDPKWPVPAPYEIPGAPEWTAEVSNSKTDDFYWNTIVPMEEELNDEDNLRKWTLGQYGSKVEFTIHNWMHTRFSELTSVGIRPYTPNPTPKVDTKYDDPNYRWLGDTYSSHVNPVFWKIHGWVENKIENWRKANGLATVPWKNTWEHGPMSVMEDLFEAGAVTDDGPDGPSGDYEPSQEALTAMAQVVAIMLREDARRSA
jgi:hypothetical protein